MRRCLVRVFESESIFERRPEVRKEVPTGFHEMNKNILELPRSVAFRRNLRRAYVPSCSYIQQTVRTFVPQQNP